MNSYEILKIIASTECELTAVEKYFLIRMLYLYQHDVVNRPLNKLTVELGIGGGALIRARNELIKKHLLLEVLGQANGPQTGRPVGRPSKSFKVNPDWSRLLSEKGNPKQQSKQQQIFERLLASPHLEKVDQLLFWSGLSGQKNDQVGNASLTSKLGVSPCMLLATLLGLADGAGVVRSVGKGELARLSGIKSVSLEYPLLRLMKDGYVRSHVTGVTGRFAYGQVAGTLFLDLSHQGWRSPATEVIVCFECVIVPSYVFDAAARVKDHISLSKQLRAVGYSEAELKEAINKVRSRFSDNGDVSEEFVVCDHDLCPIHLLGGRLVKALEILWLRGGLHHAFQDQQGVFYRFLQLKVEAYASELLSSQWNDIDKPGFLPEELLTRISEEMLPKADKKGAKVENTNQPVSSDAMALYIYLLALRMSYFLKLFLKQHLYEEIWGKMPKSQEYITMLPVAECSKKINHCLFAVSIIPKIPSASFKSRILNAKIAINKSHVPKIETRIDSKKSADLSKYCFQPASLKKFYSKLVDIE